MTAELKVRYWCARMRLTVEKARLAKLQHEWWMRVYGYDPHRPDLTNTSRA